MSVTDAMTADTIQRAYAALDYAMGWSFLLCPQARLDDADVAIVGLNPGGSHTGGGHWDAPEGNVFYTQRWGRDGCSYSPIQRQVQAWHRCLGLAPDATLLAEFIPFRSPTEASLARSDDARVFARELWTWTLRRMCARTILGMGHQVCRELGTLMQARKVASLPTGWGDQAIDVWKDDGGRRLVRMPHPSRYLLFDRADGERSAMAAQSLRRAVTL